MTAGPHKIGVTFLKEASSLLETKRQPATRPTTTSTGTPASRRRLPGLDHRALRARRARRHAQPPPDLRLRPDRTRCGRMKKKCAASILSTLMRRAYRRPVVQTDVESRWSCTARPARKGDFDAGIEMALSAVLVNPEFLFRIESRPARQRPPGGVYRISDLELASRLSFFLWSSIPDDELLDLRARRAEQARGARTAGPPHAGRPALAQPGDATSRASGCTCATWIRSPRTCACSPTSTTTCGRPSARRRSCCSRASCARIAACSTCSSRTTRS